jgi:hypothetical protein
MRRSIVWNAPAVQCSLGIEARWSLFLIVLPLDINVLPPAIGAWVRQQGHSGDTAAADGDWRLSQLGSHVQQVNNFRNLVPAMRNLQTPLLRMWCVLSSSVLLSSRCDICPGAVAIPQKVLSSGSSPHGSASACRQVGKINRAWKRFPWVELTATRQEPQPSSARLAGSALGLSKAYHPIEPPR